MPDLSYMSTYYPMKCFQTRLAKIVYTTGLRVLLQYPANKNTAKLFQERVQRFKTDVVLSSTSLSSHNSHITC